MVINIKPFVTKKALFAIFEEKYKIQHCKFLNEFFLALTQDNNENVKDLQKY